MEINSPVARTLFIMACFVIVVAGMRAAEAILVPFLLSLFIAVICTPPLIWLTKRGVPSALAMVIVMLSLVIIGVVIGVVVGSSISEFRQDLPDYQIRLANLTAELFTWLQAFGLSTDINQLRESFNPSAALSMAGNTLAQLGNMMTNALLIFLTVIFILAEEVVFTQKIKSIGNQKTLDAIHMFTSGVNRYMAIKSLMSLLTGFLVLIWLWFLEVDYFILWGMLAFLLNFVPTLGSIIAAIPAVLLALIQLGVGDAVLVGIGFMAVNFGVGNILEPRIMGKGLNLSTLVVFLSLVFWGWVLGPIGMLLSIPLTMTVKIALESSDDTRWIALILGGSAELYHPQAEEQLQRPGDHSESENQGAPRQG